ncbi:unnamed protein product [Allacma fusca]|uniref:Uncharacterized protein n=1 Tax=Allacma fusca TaxID=39272 RepID=A0A8J2JXM6_9HEXA|nr:unnamed protein product [Allacma fusca]
MESMINLILGSIWVLALNMASTTASDPITSIAAPEVHFEDNPSSNDQSADSVLVGPPIAIPAPRDGAALDYPSDEISPVDPTTDYQLEKGLLELNPKQKLPSNYDRDLNHPKSPDIYHQAITKKPTKSFLKTMKDKILSELQTLAHLTINSFSNVTLAAHQLISELANETISLAGVVGYLPELILLDGPQQLLETLKIIRQESDKKSLSALDTVIIFLEGDSKHGEKIKENIKPIFSFFPRIFHSVGTFFHTIFDTIWDLFV